ncbi:hypothetical protein NQ317_004975 [Molorchus minor]|uniref:Uncharacterized protein n=1 Tax=Molorchus minor TaxID=1323400 RepID=A0ABQ9K4A7_9CUCU|nr:hypothetical protein NQ317_004975 [Molorchus minor]
MLFIIRRGSEERVVTSTMILLRKSKTLLCTISTKEIEASANATITRQLKGVCTSHEFNVKINKLQTKILQEIDDIKYILEANGFKIPESVPNFKLSDDNLKNNNLLYKSGNGTKIPTRTEEILIHNNTISDTDEGSVYIFYWKITNVQQLLRKRETYILSPSFQVLGHDLRLNFYPNHLETGYFGIELKPNSNGFLKKHKITILNQFDATNDFYSSILYALSEKKGFFCAAEANFADGRILTPPLEHFNETTACGFCHSNNSGPGASNLYSWQQVLLPLKICPLFKDSPSMSTPPSAVDTTCTESFFLESAVFLSRS